MARTNFGDGIFVPGDITYSGSLVPGIARADVQQQDLQPYSIPVVSMRIHDNLSGLLPASATGDDLGIDGATFGTNSPSLLSSDSKAATTTQYARFQFPLPVEYTSGQSVRVEVVAQMVTTVADTSATVDVQAYESDNEGGIGSHLCSTAAQSCNSLTAATLQFVLDGTALVAGEMLDVRLAVSIVDAATGTAVKARIGRTKILCDIQA